MSITCDHLGNVVSDCGNILRKYIDHGGYAYVKYQQKRYYVTDLMLSQYFKNIGAGLTIRHRDYNCRACDAVDAFEVVEGTSCRVYPSTEPLIKPTSSGKFSVYLGAEYLGTYADYVFAAMVGNNPQLALKRGWSPRVKGERERKIYRPRGRRMKRR